MRKVKIIELHTVNRHSSYSTLVPILETKSSTDWTEVTEDEFKMLSQTLSTRSNYMLIELHDKDKTIVSVQSILEKMKKEEAARKQAEKARAEKIAEQKRKEALAREAKQKMAHAKKLERARKLLADAGQL